MESFRWLFLIYAFFSGAALGSFLDVVINRTHEEKPWWTGRSVCDDCGKTLTWRELIPVFSYIIQSGKCSQCKTKLSLEYVIIEVFAGLVFAGTFYLFGFTLKGAILGILALLLLANFISDLKYMELPDVFSIPSIILALVYQYIWGGETFSSIVIGMFVGGLFFLLQYIATKGKGLGSGDIRLGLLMGALLGWPLVVLALMISYVGGSVIAITLLLTGKMTMKSALPLGVFLIPGLILTFLFKEQAIEAIHSLFWYNTTIRL